MGIGRGLMWVSRTFKLGNIIAPLLPLLARGSGALLKFGRAMLVAFSFGLRGGQLWEMMGLFSGMQKWMVILGSWGARLGVVLSSSLGLVALVALDVVAGLAAIYLWIRNIKVAIEGWKEWGSSRQKDLATAGQLGINPKDIKPTFGQRVSGWVTGGGQTGQSIALHEQLMRSPITQQQLQPSRAVAPSTAPLVQRNTTVNIQGDVFGVDDLDRRIYRGVRVATEGG